jgi:hypothetical protein
MMKLSHLHEDEGLKRQAKARKKKVWDVDEHQGAGKKCKEGNAVRKAPTYTWPKKSFHGQSEGHAAHILP